ncbi:MAG: hypothetical protein KAU35_06490 [candidate division Zixibacteria bacterium]|nr:hypothetical protein [candidate division Zixibacteria bacterium]
MSIRSQSQIYDPAAATASDTPSVQFEYEIKTLQLSQLTHDLDVSKKRQKAREKYEPLLFWLAFGWLFIVLVILVFQAYGFYGFSLSTAVMVSVVGSTTLNVFGLLTIALKHIFPRSSKDG